MLTPELKEEIDNMSQYDLCRHWRFDPVGQSKYFADSEVGSYFEKRLREAGNFTPEISKQLGWKGAEVSDTSV